MAVKTASVIIPCYNGADVVDRAISSVYSQEYPSIELIVVDDGSTDNSKNVICAWQDRFAGKGWNLKYVYQENRGLGGAINTGLKHVTGDYISLLDADDEYLPGAVSERAAYLEEHPECDAVRSNGWTVKGENQYLFVYEQREKERKDVFVALLRGETNNWAGSYMVRSGAMFAFYPDREIYTSRYGQNLQFLLPLVYHKPCGFIDKPLMNYIQQGNSLSQTTDQTKAKSRDLENAAGYKDIRVYMTKLIVRDSKELEHYLGLIEGAYWRSILRIAAIHKDKGLLKDAYARLKQAETPKNEDKQLYYKQICRPVAFVYRVLGKIKRTIGEKNA